MEWGLGQGRLQDRRFRRHDGEIPGSQGVESRFYTEKQTKNARQSSKNRSGGP